MDDVEAPPGGIEVEPAEANELDVTAVETDELREPDTLTEADPLFPAVCDPVPVPVPVVITEADVSEEAELDPEEVCVLPEPDEERLPEAELCDVLPPETEAPDDKVEEPERAFPEVEADETPAPEPLPDAVVDRPDEPEPLPPAD